MDVVLEIMINAPSHKLPPEKDERRYANGDITSVMLASDMGIRAGDIYVPLDVIGAVRLGYLFVIDAPEIDIEVANKVLVDDPDGAVRRNWYVEMDDLNFPLKHETMTFNTLFGICHDKLDPSKTLTDMGVV
jgi:hypothetical protein